MLCVKKEKQLKVYIGDYKIDDGMEYVPRNNKLDCLTQSHIISQIYMKHKMNGEVSVNLSNRNFFNYQ